MLSELTQDKTFADLALPMTVMTVDLRSREPEPITSGPLLDALLAATALAGFVPPFKRGTQRLIDALALVPVPAEAAREAGADVTLSVNIMSRDVLEAWPGQEAPEVVSKRERMLDTLLEVMDLGQLDASIRSAAAADVPITPVFGPATWRDFELADLFLEAGTLAATDRLDAIAELARPSLPPTSSDQRS
jgi:NTE family protein